ncbi:MAG TPA: glycosyltransferase family 1 protein [Pyrinomonadaceae bacterium]|nr:glycosyltransferase family 1 protein [Pyrinomonadaceae bacterium]
MAVISDFAEENWPSMNLVADMLLDGLQRNHAGTIAATRIAPQMRRRFTRNGASERSELFKADRVLNRFWDYPRHLRRQKADFDLFHIVDHSYGQLIHELPPERTVITCHDLDTFRSILNGYGERRSFLFKSMTRRIMSGIRRAARVTCDSVATRDELLAHNLVEPERALVVPNGVHPSCSPEADPPADMEAARLLGHSRTDGNGFDIMHVGSTIRRKRIDVLLRVFAAVRKEFPSTRLIRLGGSFTSEQLKLSEQLDVSDAVIVLPHVERNILAALYRHAALVLQPSEGEGFGLPVVEALACGTPVVASNLSVLREVGGEAAAYCPVGDIISWTESVTGLLAERAEQQQRWEQRRNAGILQAAKFSWTEYANKMVELYRQIL